MKIHIPNSKKLRGPQIFCSRLYEAMLEIPNVELVDPSFCSVQLHSIEFQNVQKGVKNILRLDGVYYHNGPRHDWKKRNRPIKASFDKADGIIYQSNFSKALCEKYLGKTKVPYAVIYNGADPRDYVLNSLKTTFHQPFFLTVANWRSFKRLKDIIESFLIADLKNTNLVVVGDITKAGIADKLEKYRKDSRIQFLGNRNQKELAPYYASCAALIHIGWLDNCPNTAVEAICAGKPVICGNIGGTKEIVQKSGGIVLDIEKDYNLEPIDIYNPSPISRNLVVDAMYRCINEDFSIKNSHVDIRNTAMKYLDFFRKIV